MLPLRVMVAACALPAVLPDRNLQLDGTRPGSLWAGRSRWVCLVPCIMNPCSSSAVEHAQTAVQMKACVN
eukprot:1757389-Alexandrium_andersonii.AAC.1